MSDKKGGKGGREKGTLGIETKKEEDFGEWYSQLITRTELVDYYDVSGCYILRPRSFFMWEQVQKFFDGLIKGIGVQNCYFPMFVSERALMTEKEHVEGFAPEVAWVTKSGSSELAEPIAIRPTSETIMYPAYAKWIRSHRDLPLRLNQWTNIVRWEFKHPMPFIRTREFLWQEGHTAHATLEQASEEVYQILDFYRRVYEDILAVPVIKGKKSEKEKFAGALFTTTVEAFIPATGRAVQGGTSHCLGQNFSKMFHIEFEDENGEKQFAWQNSWGITTRTLGVMIMVHSDNRGLVLPPRVAPTQVVVIPIISKKTSPEVIDAIMKKADEMGAEMSAAGLRIEVDKRSNFTPGYKYNHWEMRGVCLRMEIGPRDLEKNCTMCVRRDTGEKKSLSMDEKWLETVQESLDSMQKDMLDRARDVLKSRIHVVRDWESFMKEIDDGNLTMVPWCTCMECEESIKTKSSNAASGGAGSAKSLCMPFEHDQEDLKDEDVCFACGKKAQSWTLFGRSY
eukprot:TRINITY_DN197_c0_g1_i1.p1 TRINITY_DN197_c0_g1~~TRINITY_DN197_c0_g1_i1.p1  ORF type:complete len:510 (-),score=155.35 TRINITY_DN197_c0_g1_i1:1489-3018(-)